jgi:hypothetical protein
VHCCIACISSDPSILEQDDRGTKDVLAIYLPRIIEDNFLLKRQRNVLIRILGRRKLSEQKRSCLRRGICKNK